MTTVPASRDVIARQFSAIAREAGEAVMRIYRGGVEVREKADRSPVTEADEVAERIILAALKDLLPGVPVIAEESVAAGVVPAIGETFVLVDPLDGTKEFIGRNGEFTVNIALVDGGRPVAGCVYAPAVDSLYAAGERAWRIIGGVEAPVVTRAYPLGGLTALSSRSHPDPQSEAFLASIPVIERQEAGSSLKFCRVAEGAADVYPRFGPTMEWDIAAGHAVLAAAGGSVVTPDGSPVRYGKSAAQFRNGPFIAWGGRPFA
jgi:3'(2'), 5'-bisphosphate nucleotidase